LCAGLIKTLKARSRENALRPDQLFGVAPKRGGRKLVISPDGVSTAASSRPRVDNTMVKALARAFRWRKLMETGVYGTAEEIAAAEKINASYVGRPAACAARA
jgi:hypothetical protein